MLSNPSFLPSMPRPVAPADGTGVDPADRTGVKLFSISPGPLFQLGLPARALQWQAGQNP